VSARGDIPLRPDPGLLRSAERRSFVLRIIGTGERMWNRGTTPATKADPNRMCVIGSANQYIAVLAASPIGNVHRSFVIKRTPALG
jgi:hypothetical protein